MVHIWLIIMGVLKVIFGLMFIVVIIALVGVMFLPIYDSYKSIDERVRLSAEAGCEWSEVGTVQGEECSFNMVGSYKFKDVRVVEMESFTCGNVAGFYDGSDKIYVSNDLSFADKGMAIAHEYCHYEYSKNNWDYAVEYYREQNKTCEFEPLIKSIEIEERYCYEYELKPWNWVSFNPFDFFSWVAYKI